MKRLITLIIVGFYSCVYCPPSKIIDTRFKIINNSEIPIQYFCSCDTIGGLSSDYLGGTIESNSLILPNDTSMIPGYEKWDISINECSDKYINLYIYKTDSLLHNEKDIWQINTYDNYSETYSKHYKLNLELLNQLDWLIIYNDD